MNCVKQQGNPDRPPAHLVDAVGPADLDVRGPRELSVPGVQPAHDLGLRAARHAALVRSVEGGPTVFWI